MCVHTYIHRDHLNFQSLCRGKRDADRVMRENILPEPINRIVELFRDIFYL